MGVKMTPEMNERARQAGIHPATVRSRLNAGWPENQAFGIAVHPMREFREMAIANGIAVKTFESRIKKDWDPEVAATFPVQTRKYRDEDMTGLVVTRAAYYYRREKLDWSHERALKTPATRRTQPLKYITEEERKIAEANGLSLGIVNGRIRRGMPNELAITEPLGKKGVKLPRKKVEVKSDGQEDELYGGRGAQEG